MTVWTVDSTDIPGFVQEERTFEELVITWRVDGTTLEDTLRPAFGGSGKFEVVPRSDGGFDVEDRSKGRSQTLLSTDRIDPDVRPIPTWYIVDYEESQLGKSGASWEVEATFSPVREKVVDGEFGTNPPSGLPPDSTDWSFTFFGGKVVTENVTLDLNRTPEGEIEGVELTMVLFPIQVRMIEESLSKLNAVNYREVPDGQDLIEDTTDNYNTVNVTPPSDATSVVPSGDYVVREWETVWNGQVYETTLNMFKAP